MSSIKRIHVMAAAIERGDEIFLARRPAKSHQGGKWEFPGGKLAAGETPLQGLARELHEELGIELQSAQPLIRIRHDYPDKSILLDVWRVSAFSGEPHGREGQPVQWVRRDQLHTLDFPAANVPIVTAVQLPTTYVISPDLETVDDFVKELQATIAQGFTLIQIRTRTLSEAESNELLSALRALQQQHPVTFLRNSATSFAGVDGAAEVFSGLHLTSRELLALSSRPADQRWVGASCHSLDEVRHAEQIGVDFVTLSPVQPTQSHPQAEPLGMERFTEWVEQTRVPVFGLGGLGLQDVSTLTSVGAQGVAGIRGLWQFLPKA